MSARLVAIWVINYNPNRLRQFHVTRISGYNFFGILFLSQAQANTYVFKYSVEVKQDQALPTPELTAISPNTGSVSGGDWVTLHGANFLNPVVHFGGTPAAQTGASSATSLQVQTPAHTWGPVDVVLTNSDGQTASLSQAFTYSASAPSISGITPSSGSVNGGTALTLTGTNFVATPRVFLGATEAAVQYVNDFTVTVTAPAQAAGVVDLTLENPDGKSVSVPGAYQYLTNASTLSTLSPSEVADTGGVEVLLTGSDFLPETQVLVDGASVPTLYNNGTALRFTSPSGVMGETAAVTAVNADSVASTNSLTLSFIAPTPVIGSLSPSSGLTLGGDTVTISGQNFRSGANVFFNGAPAASTSYVSTTTLSVVTPAHTEGTVDVTVRNPGNIDATATSAFTFSVPPTTVSSASVLELEFGTANTLGYEWAHFTNRQAKDWVGLYWPSSPDDSPISWKYLDTAGETGSGLITGIYDFIFTHGGEVELRLFRNDLYDRVATSERITVLIPPRLTALSQSVTYEGGGTVIIATGSRFQEGIYATVDGIIVPTTRVSDTEVRFTAPAHAPGVVSVRLHHPGMTLSSGELTLEYVTTPPPQLTGISFTTIPENASNGNSSFPYLYGYICAIATEGEVWVGSVHVTSLICSGTNIIFIYSPYMLPLGEHEAYVVGADGQQSARIPFTVVPAQ